MEPDQWQTDLLRSSSSRMLLLCSRQSGKSQTAAAFALRTALLEAPALILMLSPSERQSSEIFRQKFLPFYEPWREIVPPTRETALTLEMSNGSRVVALPASENNVRCFSSVRLLVVDEASKVPDELYRSVRPMLAVSQGRLIALSTPFGKRGFFYEEWTSKRAWHRVQITADQCPRITPEFLREELETMGERYFRQEYFLSFVDSVDGYFGDAEIERAISADVKPLFGRDAS
jgi:hypothetical protein